MQSKDIDELLNLFFAEGFTIDNLCQITGVSSDIIRRCINHDGHKLLIKLMHFKTVLLQRVE